MTDTRSEVGRAEISAIRVYPFIDYKGFRPVGALGFPCDVGFGFGDPYDLQVVRKDGITQPRTENAFWACSLPFSQQLFGHGTY